MHSLTSRQKEFCRYYANSGCIRESAAYAGYSQPEKSGLALLQRKEINEEIERLFKEKKQNLRQLASLGYERLAFGNVSDAIRLMFSENPLEENLDMYDLFNVAEIKRPKDNAMEIKFFDRIKALEKLENSESTSDGTGSEFYKALLGGLKKADGDKSGDENEL